MTRHKHTHTGLVTPSPLDRWIDAMLRVFAMLVSIVCSTLQMIIRRPPVNATQAMPAGLPRETSDTSQQEAKQVAASDHDDPIALMVSSTQSVRPSNREQAVRVADELVQWTNSSGERLSDSEGGALTVMSDIHPGCVLKNRAHNENAAA